MWITLLGVPGKLKTLLDRLTVARTDNLDNLNASISSRAPGSTALSTAVWDSTKAGRIDQAISTRARAKVQTGWADNPTLSAGTGEDAKFVDITITAVSDIARCSVSFVGGATTALANSGSAMTKSGGTSSWMVTARMLNSTTLRLSCVASGVLSIYGRWTVTDYAATS